jgi:hypothetical protein
MNNDRLEIIVLNKPADIHTRYVTIQDVMNFLQRVGRINIFEICAHKGRKSIFISKIDPATIVKELTDFQNQP